MFLTIDTIWSRLWGDADSFGDFPATNLMLQLLLSFVPRGDRALLVDSMLMIAMK